MEDPAKTSAFIEPHPIYRHGGYRLFCAVQRVVAFLSLLFLTPMFVILYLAVRLTSRGPFLYSQIRPGFLGKPIRVWKIRTMRPGSDKDSKNALGVTSKNPQVTALGRVLRELKIDEFPQLWNIVMGEMEFVGPRPIATPLYEQLCEKIPLFEQRNTARPGLTNLGQVSIHENLTADKMVEDWKTRFEAELHYLERKSVNYDLILIALTVLFVARKLARKVFKRNPSRTGSMVHPMISAPSKAG